MTPSYRQTIGFQRCDYHMVAPVVLWQMFLKQDES
jgi:hypothetical protein